MKENPCSNCAAPCLSATAKATTGSTGYCPIEAQCVSPKPPTPAVLDPFDRLAELLADPDTLRSGIRCDLANEAVRCAPALLARNAELEREARDLEWLRELAVALKDDADYGRRVRQWVHDTSLAAHPEGGAK